MAQQFKVNATDVDYVTQATWEQPQTDLSLNLIGIHRRYRRHRWLADVMTVAEWATLIALRGTSVAITTTDPDDPNDADYTEYYDALVQNITGEHVSERMTNVKVDFLVRA